MIPKTIHYCWFGGSSLPSEARKCIDSWRRVMPGYEIKRWDESNFDVRSIPYTAEAYDVGKYAFVSDYARFRILYDEGGVYFDTDVEALRPIDDLVAVGPFMGVEKTVTSIGVNAGLGLAAPPGLGLYRDILDLYASMHYLGSDGTPVPGTVVGHVTRLLAARGWMPEDRVQQVDGVTVYPAEYFNPLDDVTGRLTVTPHTRTIHHYAKTWCDGYGPVRTRVMRLLHRWFGTEVFGLVRRVINK